MMCRTSIFALLAAVMTFAAEGVNISVNASVDSHIDSVTVRAGSQTMTLDKNGNTSWGGWVAGTAYSITATGVATGYTAMWKVTTNGVVALSGGTNNTINLSAAYTGCSLSFYGEPNTYTVTLDRQSGSGGSSSVQATYDAAMPSATMPTWQGYTFGGYYTAANGGGTQYYTAAGASARTWNIAADTTLYAKWTANTYELNVNPNGGVFNGSTGNTQVSPNAGGTYLTTGRPAFSAIGAATRSGYTLTGYWDAATGGTQVYDATGRAVNGTYWNGSGGTATFKGLSSGTSLTVYARWTVNKYTVTLDRQNGSGGSSSVSATYDAAMPSATMPTRQGYAFGGYYAAANGGGTQYYTAAGASARTWNIASNTTLYAKWTAKEYELNVNPNGGVFNGSTGSTRVSPNSDGKYLTTGMVRFSAIGAATRTGYTLTGYWNQATGGTQVYDANGRAVDGTYWNGSGGTATFKGLADASATSLTVYARWTVKTYTVTLDGQGGSNGTSSVTATYGAAMPSATMPTRQGYAFEGYYTATSGGTQYYTAAGASARTWNIASNTTLYARWTAKQYTLIVDPNGGVFRESTEPVQVAPNAGGTYLTTGKGAFNAIGKAARTGYTLTGYYTAKTGGDKVYDANGGAVSGTHWDGAGGSAKFKGLANANANTLTVYARWSANSYPVTFVVNGGTFQNGWTSTTNYSTGVGLTLPTSADVRRTDYTFVGWYEDEAFESDRVTRIDASETGARTFYAKWKGKTYVVAFNANGGLGQGTQELSMTESEQLKTCAALNIKAPTGYSFAGWNTAADGSGAPYADGAVIYNNLTNVANAIVTLYAQWTPNPYEVAFWPNGADGGETMPNQSFTYDVTQQLDAVEFTYTGYAFRGWSTVTNRPTEFYPDGAEVVNLATGGVKNLYANWTGIVYTVSFDANGGTGAMDSITCTYNVPTNLPFCTFERDGWGFDVWTNNLAVGVQFEDHARVTNLTAQAEEVQMYACWTGATYTVVFDTLGDGVMTNGVGDEVSVLTNSCVVGDAWDNFPVPANVDTQHWDFAGWTYVDAQGVTKPIPAEVPPPSTGATNLVATWSWKVDDLAAAVDAPNLAFSTFGTKGDAAIPDSQFVSVYAADWFVQTNFVHGSTNAVQSGALPIQTVEGELGFKYVSWLTTTVEGKGVLSFWWKCDAEPMHDDGYGVWGDNFRFGLFDSAEGITNMVAVLTNHVDWSYVVYTNETDAAVSFAWAFVYEDDAVLDSECVGGGTGWVDRVTWTPLDGEVTPTHKVPYSWLRANFPVDASTDLESLAESDSPSGKAMKVWEEYWTGTNPSDPNDLFRANIAVSNDVAYISWRPDLSVTGDPVRVYHVLSAPTPSAGWAVLQSNVVEELEVPLPGSGDPDASTNRFFKVELDWEESYNKK